MIPTELEPSVTYTFVTEDEGRRAVTMPKLFIDLGDDFERWYEEEKHVLLRDFHHEFMEELKIRGNYYAKLVYDDFLKAWSHKPYYEDLIEIWEDWNKKHLEKQLEESKAKNYQQANYIQEKIKKNRHLILKAKAALYFINQTKAFVKPDFGIPDIVPPTILNTTAPTSTDGGRNKEIYISLENIEPIYNALAPYFAGQETGLRQLLEGNAIEGKVRFNESAKVLCNTFNALQQTGKIVATIEQIKIWLCRYFQANRKPYDISEGSTLNRNFQEKIERHGQILLPTIKGLITFDKP